MTAISVPPDMPHVIHVGRHARNGMAPSGELYQQLTHALNWANRNARKQFACYSARRFRQTTPIFLDNLGAGPTTHWRWRNVTGYACKALRINVLMARDTKTGADTNDLRVRVGVTPAGGAEVFTGYLHYGATEETPLDVPNELGFLTTSIEVDAATHYEVRLLGYDEARPVACLIYEEPEDPDTTVDHYTPPGYPVSAPILSTHRGDLLPKFIALLEKNRSPIWQWSANVNPITRTSATYRNVHDQTSTSHAASSAGVTVDLTGRNLRNRTTIPCTFAVYASGTGASGTAKVKLINGGGDLSVINTITTAGWYTATVNLAVGSQKLDLMIASGGGADTCSLYAMSLYANE